MNNLEIVEWWHYKIQMPLSNFTDDLYIIKKINIKQLFRIIPWIVYSNFEDLKHEKIMSVKQFNEIALYRVK